MFATAILGLPELPPDPEDERVYDLNPLRERSFQFIYDPSSVPTFIQINTVDGAIR